MARRSLPTTTLALDAARLVADRANQGLPLHVTDPTALRRVALILRGAARTTLPAKTEQAARPSAKGLVQAPMIEGLAEPLLEEDAA
jgi:hypothetical protein